MVNAFVATLAQSLAAAGSESEIFLSNITTLNGETVTTSQFTTWGRGILTIDPLSSSNIEFDSFTTVDASGIGFSGVIRGLSSLNNSLVAANIKYHPVGTQVIISFGIHNVLDLKAYIDNAFAGAIGTASDTTSGSTKVSENLGSAPRAMAALVSQQTSPNMTLKINPFSITILDSNVIYTGGNTATLVAPVSNPRIDLVVYSTVSSAIAVRGGSEAASPSAPTPTDGDIVLCSIFHRVAETTLLERDVVPNTQGYIKTWYQADRYGLITSTSSGSANAGYVLKLNSVGKVDLTALPLKFGGTGADGALTATSGNTNIDCGAAEYLEKNYTSISITGTGSITFTNPHANGTTIVIKSQGAVTLTSSTVPMFDASGMGSAGGTAATTSSNGAAVGNAGTVGYSFIWKSNTGGGGGATDSGGSTGGTAGAVPTTVFNTTTNKKVIANRYGIICTMGAGGGSGGVDNISGTTTSAVGGIGGGVLIIECAGAWNFTTTGGISVGGKTPSSGTVSINGVAGGSAGGSGGTFIALYNTLTANSGSVTTTGGTGSAAATLGSLSSRSGSGGGSGGNWQAGTAGGNASAGTGTAGANGPTGYSLVAANVDYL